MGELRDTARKNSNFLKLEIGEEIVCKYINFRIVPNNLDPTKDAAMFELDTEAGKKFWTNSSSSIMNFFDDLPKGSWVRIMRDVFKNKDGSIDPNKGSWKVFKIEPGEMKA